MANCKLSMGLLVLLFVLGCGVVLWAQGTDTTPTTPTTTPTSTASSESTGGKVAKEWTAWSTIKAGSWIGFFIILLSVAAMALIIEHFMSIKDEKLIPPDFVAALQENIEAKRFQEAVTLCESSDNYISRIMQVGLTEIPYGYESMVEAMATVGEEESIKLNQKIGYLSFIGMIAPMLGLLGTVTGMIISFNKIASATSGVDASELAYGISQALVTTCEGLLVAIPALFFHSLFQDKVTNIGLEAGAVCEELIRKFKPVKVQGIKLVSGAAAAKPAGPQGQAGLSQPNS